MQYQSSRAFAKKMDREDSLKDFRSRFHIPKSNNKAVIYLTGNSLGLQPKTTKQFLDEELNDWKTLGVEGHIHARRPWVTYHKLAKKALAGIVGAKPVEVVAMNQLTVNLHLLMVSFYRPTKTRYKIITEAGAFSSDQYAFESQLLLHGLNPEDALIELKPRDGEYVLRTEDILARIREHGPEVALVILGGVQYYSGQFFDIKAITQTAHEVGAVAGFDLAHAVGNVPLRLNKDQVDFAVWCSYKYLNSGPGGVAGAFVHENHSHTVGIPRFAGWWGHNEKERFQMKKGFKPIPGVDGWQLSNYPVLSGAAHLASLEIFQEAGIKQLRQKSIALTGFLEHLLLEIDPDEKYFTIITPRDANQRGCQLSLLMKQSSGGKSVFNKVIKSGIIIDWREPDVIRLAPVPLYNSFEEVFTFSEVFKNALTR